MDLSLMHAGLAAGAALAALPVILHLFMKQKPKRIIFPALQLIRERHKRSKKQLKIKNWLLLLARMLLLALMALALARPRLYSDVPLGDGEVATALAFVFDTSPSMQYTERGKDRLAEARQVALDILKRTTDDSEIFVIDSADPIKPEPVTPATARKKIEALTFRAANNPLNPSVVAASQVVAASTLARREVYVLTDLGPSSWELASPSMTQALDKIRKSKINVGTYVIRLAPDEIKDVAVISAETAASASAGPGEGEEEGVEVRATLKGTGPESSRVAEFYIDGPNKRGQQVVKIPADGEATITFQAPARLGPGLHQGMIKLGGGTDGLALDDTRYFSFNSRPARRILIVADRSEDDLDAFFVERALNPNPGAPSVRIDRKDARQFAADVSTPLKDYSAIFLLNLPGLGPAEWSRLRGYTLEGGGLVVAPGDRATPQGYDGPALTILPAKLQGPPTEKPTTFAKVDATHPLFSRYPKLIETELAAWPVYRHWLTADADKGRSLLRYADGSPAILERVMPGARPGRVILWTTPLSRRANPTDPASWNELPNSWAFLEVISQTLPALTGSAGDRLNYEAGENAVVAIDPAHRAPNYLVQGPDPKLTERQTVPTNSDSLLISTPRQQGQWTVDGQAPDGVKTHVGFSLNIPAGESRLAPIKGEDLAPLFGGKDNYQVADSPEGLERAQSRGRNGVELFPWLMFLILGLVTAENLLANKFHRDTAAS